MNMKKSFSALFAVIVVFALTFSMLCTTEVSAAKQPTDDNHFESDIASGLKYGFGTASTETIFGPANLGEVFFDGCYYYGIWNDVLMDNGYLDLSITLNGMTYSVSKAPFTEMLDAETEHFQYSDSTQIWDIKMKIDPMDQSGYASLIEGSLRFKDGRGVLYFEGTLGSILY